MTPRSELISAFISSRVAFGCSDATVTWYRYMLKRFTKWLDTTGKEVQTITPVDFNAFIASLREKYSPSTVAQAHGALVTFYKWLVEYEFVESDPTRKAKRPKVPDYIPPIVARDYARHMIERIQPVIWVDWRDRVIIHLLFCTGIRVGECARLKLSDIDQSNRRLTIHGKGEKGRFVPYPEELAAPLWQWVTVHRPVTDYAAAFLSSNPSGGVRGPISIQTVQLLLKRRAAEASIDFKSPHAFRHGFAVDMLRNGASTRLVQMLLGHSDIKTTERYLQLAPDLMQSMFDEVWENNPLNG